MRLLWTALVWGSLPVVAYGLAQALGFRPLGWETDAESPWVAVRGSSEGGTGVSGSGQTGVYGSSDSGEGVYGGSTSGTGVSGHTWTDADFGVVGTQAG